MRAFRVEERQRQDIARQNATEQAVVIAPRIEAALQVQQAETEQELIDVTNAITEAKADSAHLKELAAIQQRLLQQKERIDSISESFYQQQVDIQQTEDTSREWSAKQIQFVQKQADEKPQLEAIRTLNEAIIHMPLAPTVLASVTENPIRRAPNKPQPTIAQLIAKTRQANQELKVISESSIPLEIQQIAQANSKTNESRKKKSRATSAFTKFADAQLFKAYTADEHKLTTFLQDATSKNAVATTEFDSMVEYSDPFKNAKQAMQKVHETIELFLLQEIKDSRKMEDSAEPSAELIALRTQIQAAVSDAVAKCAQVTVQTLPAVPAFVPRKATSPNTSNLQMTWVTNVDNLIDCLVHLRNALKPYLALSEHVETHYLCRELSHVAKTFSEKNKTFLVIPADIACKTDIGMLLTQRQNAFEVATKWIAERESLTSQVDKFYVQFKQQITERLTRTYESFQLLKVLLEADVTDECELNQEIYTSIIEFWMEFTANLTTLKTYTDRLGMFRAPNNNYIDEISVKLHELVLDVNSWSNSQTKKMCEPNFDKATAAQELTTFAERIKKTFLKNVADLNVSYPATALHELLKKNASAAKKHAIDELNAHVQRCGELEVAFKKANVKKDAVAIAAAYQHQEAVCSQSKENFKHIVKEADLLLSQLPFWVETQNSFEDKALRNIIIALGGAPIENNNSHAFEAKASIIALEAPTLGGLAAPAAPPMGGPAAPAAPPMGGPAAPAAPPMGGPQAPEAPPMGGPQAPEAPPMGDPQAPEAPTLGGPEAPPMGGPQAPEAPTLGGPAAPAAPPMGGPQAPPLKVTIGGGSISGPARGNLLDEIRNAKERKKVVNIPPRPVFDSEEDSTKPPVVIGKPPVVIGKPPVVIGKPPVVIGKPPVVIGKPPVVSGNPPSGKPPVVLGNPPSGKPPVVSGNPPSGKPPTGKSWQGPALAPAVLVTKATCSFEISDEELSKNGQCGAVFKGEAKKLCEKIVADFNCSALPDEDAKKACFKDDVPKALRAEGLEEPLLADKYRKANKLIKTVDPEKLKLVEELKNCSQVPSVRPGQKTAFCSQASNSMVCNSFKDEDKSKGNCEQLCDAVDKNVWNGDKLCDAAKTKHDMAAVLEETCKEECKEDNNKKCANMIKLFNCADVKGFEDDCKKLVCTNYDDCNAAYQDIVTKSIAAGKGKPT